VDNTSASDFSQMVFGNAEMAGMHVQQNGAPADHMDHGLKSLQ
jgi:hypothetical protein